MKPLVWSGTPSGTVWSSRDSAEGFSHLETSQRLFLLGSETEVFNGSVLRQILY